MTYRVAGMLMNPQVVFTASLFVISELLPYLPNKYDSVVHVALDTMNKAKIIPDDVYERMEKNNLKSFGTREALNATTREDQMIPKTISMDGEKVVINIFLKAPSATDNDHLN
jgi:hypothetical protein